MFSYNLTPSHMLFPQKRMHLLCETNLDNFELDFLGHSLEHVPCPIEITPQLHCEILKARGWFYDAVILALSMRSPVPQG